jgi:hypothetical protein
MTSMDLERNRGGRRLYRGAPAIALYGGFYWLLFVLMLEPDNVLRAWRMGHPLSFGHEALRISAATVLGAAAIPVPLGLMRRFPLTGDRFRLNLLIHLLGAALMAFVLVVVGCVAASWAFEGRALPSLNEISDELTANWTLLVFAVCGMSAVVQLLHLERREAPEPSQPGFDRPAHILVGNGSRLRLLEPGDIDWIESQGNYLALHAGPQVHLIRKTLKTLESKLDDSRFVRIHRRTIVAIDRVRAMKPLTNGDAVVTLANGRELRVSRSRRDDLRRRWLGI